MGYQDLQLLKARRLSSLQLQSSSSSLDPVKSKKRYIIVTHLEKFNQNNDQSVDSSAIREEIEAQNDKTHYPLPLSKVEITSFQSLI